MIIKIKIVINSIMTTVIRPYLNNIVIDNILFHLILYLIKCQIELNFLLSMFDLK